MTERVDCVVIGAGVVGLAVARTLAMKGREVIVLEAEDAIGTITSSRNSEVIHAGVYYPTGSLKARMCVRGNRMLHAYCDARAIPYANCTKLIVATEPEEVDGLKGIQAKAGENGCRLDWMSGAEARALEPALRCEAALHSPTTSIIDSHALMVSLQGELEDAGGMVAFLSPVQSGLAMDDGRVRLNVGGAEPMTLDAATVVNCAGLGAQEVSRRIERLNPATVPPLHYCKGNYFTMTGKAPFERLIYPMPTAASLGLHYTRDMAGQGRFGPDVEWIETLDYSVDEHRAEKFYGAIRRYWPDLKDGQLTASYSGIRPKIQAKGEPAHDFDIQGPARTGHAGYVALYGIESPGLTSCLAIADHVSEMLS
ncbi:NAD(P)/FAD-dependent oxidoreductase [Caenispirillum salinarum]|uniref:NAD(P)/FAD-dependent oxidoreductase n=1 Tax=Caenispirillum salinarum TaxID=859058 RepID=UPI003850E2A4